MGSEELLYLQTEKVSVIIKGKPVHPNFPEAEYLENGSNVKVVSQDSFALNLRKNESVRESGKVGQLFCGDYPVQPMFFEQQQYELIIEGTSDDLKLEFYHENLNMRRRITKSSRKHAILSGIINFGNDIGFSDFIVRINGQDYLKIVLEVFPTKLSYKKDYQNILADVTKEVYSIAFDFLKKTYQGYQQGDKQVNTPVEFFAVLQKIYGDLLRSIDLLLDRPHHLLIRDHKVMQSHKVKKYDNRSLRWLEKHSHEIRMNSTEIMINKALGVQKRVSYDTKENRLTKYIIENTIKKLAHFKDCLTNLSRDVDESIFDRIDDMVMNLNRRKNNSFLRYVNSHEDKSGMSLVFSLALGYRDLYKYYLMLQRGLSLSGDVFHLSVKDLAVLYEYWCFIKLNSLMKDKYKMVSQDIVKIQGNGLFFSLVKGKRSKVRYVNQYNGESITLDYNPKEINQPTVTQRPDNVLRLQKKDRDKEYQYEYVFDAKYRLNPALPGTDYSLAIGNIPGPEIDDINTMHRYRDAIVMKNSKADYERKMFGAYVLFPYHDERKYQEHKFYKSIEEVNIGGLPFLPSATNLVENMLEQLIDDSPESAFERSTLPTGIEEKLLKIDWARRDVLVGVLRNKEQLAICLENNFYHIPMEKIEKKLPLHYVALYQSKNLFGAQSGIYYYGEVVRCIPLKRNLITEIPSDSEEMYYRLEVASWKSLRKPIEIKGRYEMLTNLFLLEHSSSTSELRIKSEEEYRLCYELQRSIEDIAINEDEQNLSFRYKDSVIDFVGGYICVYVKGKQVGRFDIDLFKRHPNLVFKEIQRFVKDS